MSTAPPQAPPVHSHGQSSSQPKLVERVLSFDVNSFEPITSKQEDWRFTPLKRLNGLHQDAPISAPPGKLDIAAPTGIGIEQVDRRDERLGRTTPPRDRVAAHAWTNMSRALVVSIPAGVTLAEPVRVHRTGYPGVEYAHTLIRAAAGSSSTVILEHQGQGTMAENVEVEVGTQANLTLISIHDGAADAVQLSAHHVRVGAQAQVRHVQITLGGDLVRVTPDFLFDGPGGSVEAWGLAFTDAGQHHEHRLFVDHAAPDCRSRVTYKGAGHGTKAHSVWIGDVVIRADATGTDTYEINRNLLLSPQARADSVPNLEIETGQITGAGHASTTGRFDDEQLFYLQSRGIDAKTAARLVVRGFFAEVIAAIAEDDVRQRLSATIDAELEHAHVTAGTQTTTILDSGAGTDVPAEENEKEKA